MRNIFSLFSWNVHSCVGRDGKCDPERVAEALSSLDFDIFCLQEVGWHHRGTRDFDQFEYLAGVIKGHDYRSLTKTRGAQFGNFILSRYPLEQTRTVGLGRRWGVPRCLQIADAVLPDRRRVTVMNTHLGLDPLERLSQMTRISAYVREIDPAQPRTLCGDFNTLRNGVAVKDMGRLFDYTSSGRTFPARMPALQLDRIFAAGFGRCLQDGILARDQFREASDHLPIYAAFALEPERTLA